MDMDTGVLDQAERANLEAAQRRKQINSFCSPHLARNFYQQNFSSLQPTTLLCPMQFSASAAVVFRFPLMLLVRHQSVTGSVYHTDVVPTRAEMGVASSAAHVVTKYDLY